MTRRLVIGRQGDIVLDDPSVSRKHASISVSKNGIYLQDLNSTNGTFLVKNNRLITFPEGYVQFNQRIALGNLHRSIHQLLEHEGEILSIIMDETT
jgi:pSer/pThr/pTyr-binding forkhead associated (FHA) protein